MTNTIELSIIIPVYNEEGTIAELLKTLSEELSNALASRYEVIIVDDGSTDATKKKVENQISELSQVQMRIISLQKNTGKGFAVQQGIQNASGLFVLVQDGDLEYSPSDIASLLQIQRTLGESGATYGTRYRSESKFKLTDLALKQNSKQSWFPFLFNSILTVIFFLKNRVWVTDLLTGYKVYPRSLFHNWQPLTKGFETDHEITNRIISLNMRILEVPIKYDPRSKSEGKKIGWRDGLKALRLIA
jgi:glycosyltransferase involved in cell wall biosynthesis